MRADQIAHVTAAVNMSYCRCCVAIKTGTIHRVNDWEVIGDNLSKACWSRRCVSAADSHGRTIFVADARRSDDRRFIILSFTVRPLNPVPAG